MNQLGSIQVNTEEEGMLYADAYYTSHTLNNDNKWWHTDKLSLFSDKRLKGKLIPATLGQVLDYTNCKENCLKWIKEYKFNVMHCYTYEDEVTENNYGFESDDKYHKLMIFLRHGDSDDYANRYTYEASHYGDENKVLGENYDEFERYYLYFIGESLVTDIEYLDPSSHYFMFDIKDYDTDIESVPVELRNSLYEADIEPFKYGNLINNV